MYFASRKGHSQFYYMPYDKLIDYFIVIKRGPSKENVSRIRSK